MMCSSGCKSYLLYLNPMESYILIENSVLGGILKIAMLFSFKWLIGSWKHKKTFLFYNENIYIFIKNIENKIVKWYY